MASSSTCTALQPSRLPSEPLPWRPNTRPKLPPDALLDIADDLLWDLFTEWLPFESVCHLDSALCQKRRRPEFLQLLATKVLLFNREEVNVLTEPYEQKSHTHRALGTAALNWVLNRGIHLASLQLRGNCEQISIMNSLRLQGLSDIVASLALDGRFDKLETIILTHCTYINDADLAVVLSKCYTSMKSVNIQNCVLTESATAHIKRCTKLEAFAPSGYESAAEMVEIFQACRKLRKVDLSGFRHRLTNEVVRSVAVNCPLLEHLDLGVCYVSEEAVRIVAESCPLLQFANFYNTNITDASMVSLCNRCRLLKRLFLACCYKLTDAAVLSVAERLPGLTHIDLTSFGRIDAITSSAVETLASKCRELEYFDLRWCTDVSDVTLMKIAQYCSKLEVLRVTECPNVTAVGVAEIRSKCAKLKTFEFDKVEDEDEDDDDDDDDEGDDFRQVKCCLN